MITDDIATLSPEPAATASWSVSAPAEQRVPLVFTSPHSGCDYPEEFVAASRLDPLTLRRSEDAFVDRIFAATAEVGAPLLKAHFPRAFVDPNREPFELDPEMFEEPLPPYVNTTSPRVAAGLGTVARVVTSGDDIYARKLRFTEVQRWIDRHYRPYHAALRVLLEKTRARFGVCLLVDCHSMPSVGGPMDSDCGRPRVDAVLGDRFGTSCAPAVTDTAAQALRELGYSLRRNIPYAGGYTTSHYGRPQSGIHALQIEINRALYMDEDLVRPTAGLTELQRRMRFVIQRLAALDRTALRAT